MASPASVNITAPSNLTFLNLSPTTVNGTVSDPTAVINVNGIPTPNSGGSFSVSLPLREGNNTITATAQSADGLTGSASIQVTLDTTPPRVTIVSPTAGFVTTASSINVSGSVNDLVVGTVNQGQVSVTVNSVPAQVANRSFLVNIPLATGTNNITATGIDQAGNSFTTTPVAVTRIAPGGQPQIQIISGNNQNSPISSPIAAPLAVELTDATGKPVPNASVIFKVIQNNGMVQAAGQQPAVSLIVPTDSNGQAQATWTLGTHSGAGSDMVEAYAVGYSGVINFSATATQSQPGLIVVDTGNTQTGAAGQPLPLPFVAVVTDSGFNRLPNVPVTFTVQRGGGAIGGQTTYTTTSDSDGRVQAVLTLGLQEGMNNNLVSANFAGNTGLPATFTASGMVAGDASATTVTGVVLDNANNPLAGVTVRAVPLAQYIQTPGSISTLPSVPTNSQGQFIYPQAPVGSIKLVVDGSTAQSQNTFPALEYDMVTVAGQANTVGKSINLVPLDTVNQLCVSETQGGVLTLPQWPGFSLTVAAGSATFPGGSRQGCISVTPVHADKIPMTPGFGQQPRFIVTIQPTGTTFNPPAPITLPNVDGLAPRTVTEMYSYDHDLSSFVSIGNGTVSADGTILASNAGVGVLKAGWHCGGNTGAIGTVADCPPCQSCQGPSPGSCQGDPGQAGQPCSSPLNDCYSGGTCSGLNGGAPGSCLGGTPLTGVPCNAGGYQSAACYQGTCEGRGNACSASCEPSNACLVAGCANGVCQPPTPAAAGTPCSTGGTTLGSCNGSGACAGIGVQCPSNCATQNSCLIAACSETGCTTPISAPSGTPCASGGNAEGVCDGTGSCKGSDTQCPASCAPANICQLASCSNGQCGPPANVPDSDMRACNGSGGVCVGGVCVPASIQVTLDVSTVQVDPYVAPTVTSAVSTQGGTYTWTTDNAAVLSVVGATSGPGLTSVPLALNGQGTSTITVTYILPNGTISSDAVTFVLTRNIAVVGWIDPNAPDLASLSTIGVSPALVSDLNSFDCLPTVFGWTNAGNTGEAPTVPVLGLQFAVINPVDRAYANTFLIENSANSNPGTQLNGLYWGDPLQFRVFTRFQASYAVKNGQIIPTPNYLTMQSVAGDTKNPCFNFNPPPNVIPPGFPSPAPQVHPLSGAAGIRSDHKAVYLITQARVGPDGQAGDTYLNDQGGIVGLTTPWVYISLQFDLSGNLITPIAHQTFPTYSVYEFAPLSSTGNMLFVDEQQPLQSFINLDSTSQIGLP